MHMMGKPNTFKRLRDREQGATIIEFALTAIFFFFIVFAIFEFSLLYWVNLTMQHAVREGARYAVTGRKDLDPGDPDDPTYQLQRYKAVIQQIKNQSMGLYNKVHPTIVVNGVEYGDPENYPAGMFGNPGEVIVLQLNCSWPLLTPMFQPYLNGGDYRFSVAATMRNEGF